jgi:hypothetical protein
MNPENAWQRLAAAARRAPDARDTAAPYGFAARVAALAMAPENRPAPLFGQFSLRVSLRVLGAASALAVVAAAASYPAAVNLFSDGGAPASSHSSPAGSGLSQTPAAAAVPSPETAGAAPSSGDDPVADLVDMVS